jgi:hypothetical protein
MVLLRGGMEERDKLNFWLSGIILRGSFFFFLDVLFTRLSGLGEKRDIACESEFERCLLEASFYSRRICRDWPRFFAFSFFPSPLSGQSPGLAVAWRGMQATNCSLLSSSIPVTHTQGWVNLESLLPLPCAATPDMSLSSW